MNYSPAGTPRKRSAAGAGGRSTDHENARERDRRPFRDTDLPIRPGPASCRAENTVGEGGAPEMMAYAFLGRNPARRGPRRVRRMHMISRYFNVTLHYFDRLNSHQWIWLLIGIVLLGLYCMRGFGSRAKY